MRNLNIFLTLSFVILSRIYLFAGEGMWIPMLLQQMNEKEMKEMGMKITAEDIYSINKSSLKDAIVLFGRGCTGEIISNKGYCLPTITVGMVIYKSIVVLIMIISQMVFGL